MTVVDGVSYVKIGDWKEVNPAENIFRFSCKVFEFDETKAHIYTNADESVYILVLQNYEYEDETKAVLFVSENV